MMPATGKHRRVWALITLAVATTGVLAAAGPAAQSSTPGKNGDIVFAADDGLGFELYTIGPNGAHLRQITHVDGDAVAADWSPDGRRIAFELDAQDHAGIAIVDADGSNLRELTHTGFKGQPAFTPDGKHLVYSCDCEPQGIFIMRVDGTHRRRLSANPFPRHGDDDANVSPDGKTVTYVRRKVDAELQALFAVDIDGGNERLIAPYRLEVAVKHDWAPDGSHIVITTDADYPNGRSPNVATIEPDGSNLTMLTSYGGGAQGAFAGSYSPNGRWIVFRLENLEQERFELFKFHPNGAHRELIARLPFAPRGIDWGTDD